MAAVIEESTDAVEGVEAPDPGAGAVSTGGEVVVAGLVVVVDDGPEPVVQAASASTTAIRAAATDHGDRCRAHSVALPVLIDGRGENRCRGGEDRVTASASL